MNISQCDRILRHLRDHGSITAIEAFSEYGILRLAAQVTISQARSCTVQTATITHSERTRVISDLMKPPTMKSSTICSSRHLQRRNKNE